MFNTTITEEQRLEKAISALMAEPYLMPLAPVIMLGKRQIDDKLPTACTNGIDETYGRKFVHKCSDKALRGCLLHELGHKMFRHLTTWGHLWKHNPRKANVAADYVVNLWVKELIDNGVNASMDWPKPAVCLLDPKYKRMSVQQVYNLLPDDGNGGDGGMDNHDWESAQEMTDAEVQELAEQIDSALRQGAMAAQKAGDGNALDLGQLLVPKINWREALREFVSATCAGNDYATWSRPNRRFIGAGMYMPSGVSQQVQEIVVGVDTSGSIDAEALREFLSEIVGICEQVKPQSLRLIYWDHRVQSEEVYDINTVQNFATSTKPVGGGGTDASCVPSYLREKGVTPQAVVMLTDGYVSSWGRWDVPVLWCVIGSKAVPPVGRVVYVEAA